MKNLLVRLLRDEEGQDLIEYGLLVGIITIAAVTAIINVGASVQDFFADLDAAVPPPD